MKTILAALVRLFPRAFRAHFGEPMLEHAIHDLADQGRAGLTSRARAFAAISLDLMGAAITERLRPSWICSRLERRKRRKGEVMGIELTDWGGEVKLADFKDGYSTTRTIEKMTGSAQ